MTKFVGKLFLGSIIVLAWSGVSRAGWVVSVDENGNGTLNTGSGPVALQSALINDPGVGGLNNVLTYTLPFAVVEGSIEILDAETPDHHFPISDLLRWENVNGTGKLFFYSDNTDGHSALADVGIPDVRPDYQVGNPGANDNPLNYFAAYGYTFPGSGISVVQDITYSIHSNSDAAVPEPSTFALLGLGGIGLAFGAYRRRRMAVA